MDNVRSAIADIGIDLGRVVGFVVLLAIVFALARIVSRWLQRRVENALASRSFGRNGAVLIGRLSAIATYLVAVIGLLASAGVSWTGLLTFLGAFTVALGLSLQDVLKNFFSGIFLLMERPFKVGDHIRLKDIDGEVQGIDVRTTMLKIQDGSLVMVPNSIVFTEVLTNRSKAGLTRLDLDITSIGRSLGDTERLIHSVLAEIPEISRPIPAPIARSVARDESVFGISLLLEASESTIRDVIGRLVASVDDGSIKVVRR